MGKAEDSHVQGAREAVRIARIARQYVHFEVTATLWDGSPVAISGVDVALLENGHTPDGDTAWTPAAYANGVAVVLLAGPDADPTGAFHISRGGGELWARVVDDPEVEVAHIDRVAIA